MSKKAVILVIIVVVFVFAAYFTIRSEKGSEDRAESTKVSQNQPAPAAVPSKAGSTEVAQSNTGSAHQMGAPAGERTKRIGTPIGPAMIMEYTTNCGNCHVPFRPELLPASGWGAIFSHLDDHFGQKVDLSERDRDGLLNYLQSLAADRSYSEIPRKIMNSLGNKTVERITEVPYIEQVHDEIDPAVFKRESIGKFSNCIACHKRTVEGIYGEVSLRIPE